MLRRTPSLSLDRRGWSTLACFLLAAVVALAGCGLALDVDSAWTRYDHVCRRTTYSLVA